MAGGRTRRSHAFLRGVSEGCFRGGVSEGRFRGVFQRGVSEGCFRGAFQRSETRRPRVIGIKTNSHIAGAGNPLHTESLQHHCNF